MPRKKNDAQARVRIVKYVKVKDKWNFYIPVFDATGNPTDKVVVGGVPQTHTEGRFYIEWWERGQRKRYAIENPAEVVREARRKHAELRAIREGLSVTDDSAVNRLTVRAAQQEFASYSKTNLKPSTAEMYRYNVNLFAQSCVKVFLDEVERRDILDFIAFCRSKKFAEASIRTRVCVVMVFLRHFGNRIELKRSDRPRAVQALVETYDEATLEALFIQATKLEALTFKFYLASGFRFQEVMYLTWRDLDFKRSTASVTAKPQWGFTPKNWEERTIPLPTSVMTALAELRDDREAKPTDPVFPTRNNTPDLTHDSKLKRIAFEAELNCGQCKTRFGNRCVDGPFCERFHLHKFRHTFAVEQLHSDLNMKDLQFMLGHKSMQSTMIYLRAYQPKGLHAKVNSGSLAALVS